MPRAGMTSGRVNKYDAFRRAPPAAAGRRPPHTYHQYASGVRRGQRRPVIWPDYAPYFRTSPLARRRAEHERPVEHAAHTALDLQLALEVRDVAQVLVLAPAQDLGGEQPH